MTLRNGIIAVAAGIGAGELAYRAGGLPTWALVGVLLVAAWCLFGRRRP